jgi:hypothetical protein
MVTEHYHITCFAKDGTMREVTIFHVKTWQVVDEWGDISKEDKILFTGKTISDAIEFSIKILEKKYPKCTWGDGAGYPPHFQNYLKRV